MPAKLKQTEIILDAFASFFVGKKKIGIKKAPAKKAEAQAKVYNKPLYPTQTSVIGFLICARKNVIKLQNEKLYFSAEFCLKPQVYIL